MLMVSCEKMFDINWLNGLPQLVFMCMRLLKTPFYFIIKACLDALLTS